MLPLTTRHTILLILGVLFTIYCLFQARFLILGPGVAIESPGDGFVANSSLIMLSGTARNAAWLSLNDRQIYTNEEGQWSEKLILSEGLSIMTVRVRDRFGREAEDSVRLILN